MNPAYWLALLDRAVKTAAQAAILMFGAGQVDALAVDWRLVAGFALGGFVLSVLTSLATSGIRGNGPSATTERVVRTTRAHVPFTRNEGGWAVFPAGRIDAAALKRRIGNPFPDGRDDWSDPTAEDFRDQRGQVDAAYLLKVIVLALVAVLIVAVLFGAVPLDL